MFYLSLVYKGKKQNEKVLFLKRFDLSQEWTGFNIKINQSCLPTQYKLSNNTRWIEGWKQSIQLFWFQFSYVQHGVLCLCGFLKLWKNNCVSRKQCERRTNESTKINCVILENHVVRKPCRAEDCLYLFLSLSFSLQRNLIMTTVHTKLFWKWILSCTQSKPKTK